MSYHSLYYHLIFATKNRRCYLTESQLDELYRFTTGILRNLNITLCRINGPSDHVHLALSARPDQCISDCARAIKANTSRWIHRHFECLADFAWQEGYSVFSVSKSNLPQVIRYIKQQREHHKRVSFDEELKMFLEKHQIEYNPI